MRRVVVLLAALVALLADMLEDQFIDARSLNELEALFAPAGERGLRSVPVLGAAHEPVAPETRHLGDPAGADFLGSRTGTHRRRGVAQSA
jgi:hypothetical protein